MGPRHKEHPARGPVESHKALLGIRRERLGIAAFASVSVYLQPSGRRPQEGSHVARSMPSLHPPCSFGGSRLPVLWRSVPRSARSDRQARAWCVARHVGLRERGRHGRGRRGMQRAARLGLDLRRTPRTRRCRAESVRTRCERHAETRSRASFGCWGEAFCTGGSLWGSSELFAAAHGCAEKEAVTGAWLTVRERHVLRRPPQRGRAPRSRRRIRTLARRGCSRGCRPRRAPCLRGPRSRGGPARRQR